MTKSLATVPIGPEENDRKQPLFKETSSHDVLQRRSRLCEALTPTYEKTFWVIFLLICGITIADRFTTNAWPRQSFLPSTSSMYSSDNFGYKPGPWSVHYYDVVARVSGRYTMVALNALFVTMMHSFHLRKYRLERLRIHTYIGISISVVTLLHVWAILTPAIFHGYEVMVKTGKFVFPLSEKSPPGFKDVRDGVIMMQGDDVWRIVIMTIMLGMMMPYMYMRFHVNYRFVIRLHQFVAAMYFIDIVRRHSHPHSWVLNTPFVLLFIVDRVIQSWWRYEKLGPEDIMVESIGDKYLALHFASRYPKDGFEYLIRIPGHKLERVHPFTCFDFEGKKVMLVRVYDGAKSHTKKIQEQIQTTGLEVWGGFPFDFKLPNDRPISLVGGGSGFAFIVEAFKTHSDLIENAIYSTNDAHLEKWVRQYLPDDPRVMVVNTRDEGHVDYRNVITDDEHVYCQGSRRLQKAVRKQVRHMHAV